VAAMLKVSRRTLFRELRASRVPIGIRPASATTPDAAPYPMQPNCERHRVPRIESMTTMRARDRRRSRGIRQDELTALGDCLVAKVDSRPRYLTRSGLHPRHLELCLGIPVAMVMGPTWTRFNLRTTGNEASPALQLPKMPEAEFSIRLRRDAEPAAASLAEVLREGMHVSASRSR
jgi:hypothetical protein